MKKEIKIWDDCICGMMNVHTIKCKRNHRKNWRHHYSTMIRKELRDKRVRNKCCASCGKKVKPKIIFPYRCEDCQNKQRSKFWTKK